MDDVPAARQRTGPELGKWYNPLRDRTRSDIRERPFYPKVAGSRPARPTSSTAASTPPHRRNGLTAPPPRRNPRTTVNDANQEWKDGEREVLSPSTLPRDEDVRMAHGHGSIGKRHLEAFSPCGVEM